MGWNRRRRHNGRRKKTRKINGLIVVPRFALRSLFLIPSLLPILLLSNEIAITKPGGRRRTALRRVRDPGKRERESSNGEKETEDGTRSVSHLILRLQWTKRTK